MGNTITMTEHNINTIVIVGTQRSGTTWLMQVLSQIPSFRVYGEVFREIRSPEFRGDPALKPDKFFLEYQEHSSGTPLKYVDEILATEKKVTVFKIMYDQIRRNRGLFSLLASENVLVINVERYNIFEMALSKCIARRTGIYHTDSDGTFEGFTLEYSVIYRLMLKEKLKKLISPRIIRLMSKNYNYFVYERLLENFTPLIELLEKTLGISNLQLDPTETKWKKTSKSKKDNTVLNYEEISRKLQKSIFKEYIK